MNLVDELSDQLDWWWDNLFRTKLDGLTDDEYLWEPAPGCWSLRPQADGTWSADFTSPAPEPPPVTTIAWRMAHISVGVLGERAANHFGAPPISYATVEWPGTADGGIALLDERYAHWKAGVRALTQDDLDRPCGPAEGPFADAPLRALILHVNREVLHHGAEILLLRDLYRATTRT